MHHIVTRVLLNKSSYTDSVNTTPYFAGIIAGSVVWVCYAWVTRLVGLEWCSLCLLWFLAVFAGFFLVDGENWSSVRLWDSRLSESNRGKRILPIRTDEVGVGFVRPASSGSKRLKWGAAYGPLLGPLKENATTVQES
ncbi:hypothetical protein B0H14DRAFT_2870322 [Mycena olivaceomarginata]|nr:hypothetical protein B0H14DRAFT_2870322 [Mycena olivaceomarginata]